MNADDYRSLDGRTVLVRSTRDRRDPPTAIRGTLRVDPVAGGSGMPSIRIELALPEMFTAPAHRRVLTLDGAAVAELLRSEVNGTYSCLLDYDLEKDTRDQTSVSPEARGGKPAASD